MMLSHRKRLIPLLLCLLAIQFTTDTRADEKKPAAARRLLIDGEVLDAVTGEHVKSFRVIPGVRYNRAPGVRGNLAVWQPHMIREMTDGNFQWPRTRGYDEMRFRIEADGYRPATTTWLGKGGPHLRMKVHMRPDSGIVGIVLKPDGTLAVGAILALGLPNRGIRLKGYEVVGHNGDPPDRLSDRWRIPQTVETDLHGNFVLPYETDAAAVLCVVHESGYFEQNCVDFTESLADRADAVQIQLHDWSHIAGRVLWKNKPGSGERIRATVRRNEPYPELITAFSEIEADQTGRYSFDYLPPGDIELGHKVKSPETDSKKTNKNKMPQAVYEYPILYETLEPGQNAEVDFGGEGSTIVGRLSGLKSYEQVSISIRPPAPNVWGQQKQLGNLQGGNNLQQGYATLQATAYAPLYFRENLSVNADGTFTINDVMTGDYNLWVQGAAGSSQFTVKESNTKFSIGTVHVKP